MSNRTDRSSGWSYVGYGIAWFLFCVGVGSCTWLEKQNGPLVIVKHEPSQATVPKAP